MCQRCERRDAELCRVSLAELRRLRGHDLTPEELAQQDCNACDGLSKAQTRMNVAFDLAQEQAHTLLRSCNERGRVEWDRLHVANVEAAELHLMEALELLNTYKAHMLASKAAREHRAVHA